MRKGKEICILTREVLKIPYIRWKLVIYLYFRSNENKHVK